MSVTTPNDEYTVRVPVDGSKTNLDSQWNAPILSFAVQNLSAVPLTVIDDSGATVIVNGGDTRMVNCHTYHLAYFSGGSDKGPILLTIYNYPHPLQNALGNVVIVGTVTISGFVAITGPVTVTGTVSISGTVAVSGAVTVTGTVTVSGTVSISGSVTISGPVTISGTVTVTGSVTVASGSITINNSGPINTITPDTIAQYNVLDNTSVAITLTRQSGRVTVQPVLSTLTRGGLLTVTVTDSTTQTYEFLEEEPIQTFGTAPLGPMMPWSFDYPLKSGAVATVKFTGRMGVIVGY